MGRAGGMCLFDDALTSGSAIVSKTHSPCSQSCDFWEKILRYYDTKAVRSNRKVGGHYYADRKYTKTIDTIDKTNYNSNMMNYKSGILRKNRTFFTKSKILEKVVKQVQDDKLVSEAHSKHLVPYCLSNLVSSKKAAFTLAEVLITLGIMGIVAAMTLTTLISKYPEKQTVSQLTKVYSTLASAHQMMQAEYGSMDTWGLRITDTGEVDEDDNPIYDRYSQNLVAQRLRPYFRVNRDCKQGEICDNRTIYNLAGAKYSDPAPSTAEASFWLSDGILMEVGWYGFNKSIDIAVTLPGKEKVLGKNYFYFTMNSKGIYPEGMWQTSTNKPFENCSATASLSVGNLGRGCTAWVIYNKNMDYLHCRDKLSWDGAHSCKDAE